MVPTVDGTYLRFTNAGLYDGLFVMQDTETLTLWNHITGEALYGPYLGRSLGPVGNILQVNVKQALAMNPETRIAISDRAYTANGKTFGTPAAGRGGGVARGAPRPDAQMSPMFVETLGAEDTRRPRMELGLGLWAGDARRYYPMEVIRERGNAMVDTFAGRPVVIYIDPETFTPVAVNLEARSAAIKGLEVRLDGGRVIRSGVLYDAQGQRQAMERPQQLFTRWYGFALTLPGPEIYGDP